MSTLKDVPVIEPDPTFGDWSTKSRHPGNIFRNCDCIRKKLMNHIVSQLKVGQRFRIGVYPEVLVVVSYSNQGTGQRKH